MRNADLSPEHDDMPSSSRISRGWVGWGRGGDRLQMSYKWLILAVSGLSCMFSDSYVSGASNIRLSCRQLGRGGRKRLILAICRVYVPCKPIHAWPCIAKRVGERTALPYPNRFPKICISINAHVASQKFSRPEISANI